MASSSVELTGSAFFDFDFGESDLGESVESESVESDFATEAFFFAGQKDGAVFGFWSSSSRLTLSVPRGFGASSSSAASESALPFLSFVARAGFPGLGARERDFREGVGADSSAATSLLVDGGAVASSPLGGAGAAGAGAADAASTLLGAEPVSAGFAEAIDPATLVVGTGAAAGGAAAG
jgi:hypothetical protein